MTSNDDTTDDAKPNRSSRRAFVGLVGAAVSIGIAGCTDTEPDE